MATGAVELDRIGVEIGVVLSRASASYAPILLRRDVENSVREEDLAVIVDDSLPDYYPFGVIRWVTRHEPFLKHGVHNVYVENPEALTRDIVMPFSNAYVEIYGALCFNKELCPEGEGFTSNTHAPHPSSKVYRVVDASPLSSLLSVAEPVYVGRHKYSGWRLPLDSYWAPYHVGVFGATGSGKSRLVMRLVSQLASKGYSFIVFDHTGVDYVPFAKASGVEVIPASSIEIPLLVFSETLASIMGIKQSTYTDIVDIAVICHDKIVKGETANGNSCLDSQQAMPPRLVASTARNNTQRASSSQPGRKWSKNDFIKTLREVAGKLNTRRGTLFKLVFMIENMVPDYLLEKMGKRSLKPAEVVEKALQNRIVVVDLSSEQSIEVKRSIVASVVQAGWSLLFEKGLERLGLGVVVDEAQNYACEYCNPSARELETLAREGRKWGFFLVVASQRVARDIKTSIRSNLGTVFFSKLQATGDLQELAGYLDLGRVSEASLAMLRRREFFAAGLMNPLRRPLLLVVDSVEKML